MKNKIIITVIAVLLVFFAFSQLNHKNNSSFKVGAILPMTGASSIFGEQISRGMNLALLEIENNKIQLEIEDSQANPSVGLSAYQNIINGNPNVVVSAFSGVSVPISKLSLEKNIPLIMTIVAGDNVTNDFSYRYYAKPEGYAKPAFFDEISPIGDEDGVAVLYRNDEYGNSVKKEIEKISYERGKPVLISEGFLPDSKDFRTQLLKIKESKPKVLIFVVANAGEGLSIVKNVNELGINLILIEASAAFSDKKTQESLPPGKTYYSTSFDFLLTDKYKNFEDKYRKVYSEEPYFAAALGYDIVNLIYSCHSEKNLNMCLNDKKIVEGVTGKIENITNHEINPPMRLIKIEK